MTLPSLSQQPLRLFMGFYFYPRGGSAYVTRDLCRHYDRSQVQFRLVSGSLVSDKEHTFAPGFYRDIPEMTAVDYTPAVQSWETGSDPLLWEPPLHASYEDRQGVPDRVFGRADADMIKHQEQFWSQTFTGLGADEAEIIHVHHLTPQLEPALSVGCPVVIHLHGTDLKFLTACRLQERGEIESAWPYATMWHRYLAEKARRADVIVAVSPGDAALAADLLGVEHVRSIPNGVDTKEFDRMSLSVEQKRAFWRHWLIEDPKGWDESGVVGSIRYIEDEVARLLPCDGSRTVLLCVTRFLSFKRIPLLLEAYARVRQHLPPTTLVIWGGFPGECEGPHPATIARDLGLEDVVFTGFRDQEDLRFAFNCADVLVNAARHEPFGLVLIQAMASGMPIIAADSGGPATFVHRSGPQRNGWLFAPGSDDDLEQAIKTAALDPDERRIRGEHARDYVRRELAWPGITQKFIELYQELVWPRRH